VAGWQRSRAASTGCRQLTIGLEDESEGFLQIAARLGERSSLGVHARDFLHKSRVPSPTLLDHSGKFSFHMILWSEYGV